MTAGETACARTRVRARARLPNLFNKRRKAACNGGISTMKKLTNISFSRRTLVKAGAALGASTIFSPPILTFAQGESPIKIGMHDPLTGTYAAEGDSEARGARMALAEVNAKGGILGRKVELVIEDEGANA